MVSFGLLNSVAVWSSECEEHCHLCSVEQRGLHCLTATDLLVHNLSLSVVGQVITICI